MKLILITFLFYSSMAHAITKFETDYCTNYPEGTLSKPDLWKHCCLIHDMYFWAGGSKQDRDLVDLDLKACIEKTGAPEQARIMYMAVRAGSYSPIKYPKRKWNNGWGDSRDVRALTLEDMNLIEDELRQGYEFITEDIKTDFIKSLRSRLE